MTGGSSLILTRSDIEGLASPADYYDAVAAGFRARALGRSDLPPPMEIHGVDGAFHAKGAGGEIDGRRLAALKLNGNFPFNSARNGLPTVQGAILLCDAVNGVLAAIMDSIEITLRRTAAASAVAMDLLAKKDVETLLICGCGVQGRAHAEALAHLRPFRRILAYDADREKTRRFASDMERAIRVPIDPANDLAAAAQQSDVIATATTAHEPILHPSFIRPGAFIAAVGADSPAKNEISSLLMERSAVITDVTDQCAIMGDLRAAIASGALTRDSVRAELGDVVAGSAQGRLSDGEIIIFDSTGAAFQDLAAAAMAYDRAKASGKGAWINLRR